MTTPDSKLRDYGVGVTAVALAFVIRWLLTPVLGSDLPYPTFFLAVMLTAWVGGLRPALLALVLSLPLAGYFFVAPRYSLVLAGAREAIGFGIFTFVSLLMSIMSDSLRKAWQEASTTNLDLLAQQKRLELEMGERERAQLEAHTQREWFRVTFSSIGDGVIACDTNSRVTYLNGVAQALTGWSQDEAAGRLIHEVFRIVNEHSHAPVEDPVAKVLREGRIVGLANHTILIDRLGVERAIDDSAAPIKDETGNILGVVLIFRDVSERRQSSLYRSRLVALVRSSEDAIIGYDLSGVITSWNAGAERMYGFRAEEVLGKRLIETIVPPDGVEAFVEILQRIKRGERLNHFEAERLRHDGQHVDVSISVSPVEMQGEVVGVAAIDRDVTARKATERRRNARLAITQILATEKDIGEAGRRILEAVCRGLQWDLSCLWLVDPASDVLRCRETWADPERHLDEFERASRALVFHRGDNFPGRIWASGDPEWVPDVVDDPDFHRAEPARQAGFHGAFAFPVTSGDEVLGVVEFFSRDVREPDADLLEMMTTIGGQMGQFLKQCQIEQNLRRSEAELADFFENATIGLHWVNPEGIVIRVNQAELDMLGYRREEYLGHHIAEFHADPPVIEDILQRLSRGETLHELPARLRCKDGAIKQVMISSNVYREAGRFVHTRCFTRDVTIQKQVEQSLRESEKRFRTLAFNAPAAIFIKDLEGRYTFANKLACETLNRPEGLVGCTDRELMPAESAAGLEQHDREVIATGQPIETVEHVLGPGFDFQFLSVKFPLTDDHGQIEGVCGVAVDITGRMHAEKRLLESERRFAALAELVPQLVWTAGPDGNVDYFNQRWYDYTGAIYEQSVGDGWVEFVHPDDRATSLKHWQESLRTGTPAEVEHRMRSASGSYSWFLVRGVPVRDDSQRIVKWFGTCTNIDTHKRVERSVRFLADASAALASLVDYESTLQRVAKLAVPFVADWCFVDMLEADGSLRPVAVAHGDPERVKLARAILAREPARDNGFAPPFDEPRIVEQPVKTWPLAGELGLRALLQVPMRSRGRTMGLLTFASAESARLLGQPDLALAEDLAHRAAIAIENARLYQETREADRRKDEFLATLAHELRNPLAPISNCVQIMQHRQLEDPQLQWAQDIIGRQVRHLARLVDDLLDISRITRGKFRLRSESLELVALVERAIENSRAAIAEKNLNFEVKLPDAPVPMVGDATRLEQVLSNLLSNASKYTEPGGSITLTMTRDEAGVTIRVRDTGIGIDNELVEHVFDMFVQADHGAQGGLGIGLSLVKRLVEMHGGEVTAQSAGKGQGSEFIVRLPVRAGTTCTQTRDEQIREQRPPQRILVVDDNVDAADSLAALLRLQGHEVRIAHDGPDGLELAEQFHPQLVFLDLGMPHMDGFEVASRLQQNLAAAILIAVTGWGQQQDRQRTRQAGFHHHLVKPVTPEVLNDLLDHLLG